MNVLFSKRIQYAVLALFYASLLVYILLYILQSSWLKVEMWAVVATGIILCVYTLAMEFHDFYLKMTRVRRLRELRSRRQS